MDITCDYIEITSIKQDIHGHFLDAYIFNLCVIYLVMKI